MFNRIFCVMLCCLAFMVKAGAFPLKVAGADTLNTAIWIHDLTWGTDLVKRNIDRSLVPASVMKTVTTASLLSLADIKERFSTEVDAVGRIDGDGTLTGDIVIHANGDPTIDSQFFRATRGFADSIAAAAAAAGISRVAGTVVIDESAFPDATTPPGWMAEDIPWPYGARLQGANFADNRFRLSLPSKTTVPFVPGLKVELRPGRGKKRSRYTKIDRADGSETVVVSGNTRRRTSENLSMPYPRKAMRAAIIEALRGRGIEVADSAAAPAGNRESIRIYTHLSPTFGEIMRSLMHRSDNLMAEGILRAIAPGGTRADALREEAMVWTMAGVSPHGVTLVDGSGLSRQNRLTARYLGEIYRHMAWSPDHAAYAGLFPLAGFQGTVRNLLAETPLAGRVALKSGSMKGVQSYAGYMLDADGKPTHIIVFIANGFKCSRPALKKAFERLLLDTFSVDLQNE